MNSRASSLGRAGLRWVVMPLAIVLGLVFRLRWFLGPLTIAAFVWLFAHNPSVDLEPLWTEADLPPIPAAEENGWSLELFEDVPCIPPALKNLPYAPEWAEVSSNGDDLRAFLNQPEVTALLERIAEAQRRDRFVNACWGRLDEQSSCEGLAGYHALQIVRLSVLAAALDGRWVEVFARTNRLLRAELDYAGHSRDFLVQTVGNVSVLGTLSMTDLLLKGAEAGDGSAMEGLSKLAATLESIEASTFDVTGAFKGEYVVLHDPLVDTFALAQRGAAPMDFRHTRRFLDGYMLGAMEFVASGEGAPPDPPRLTKSLGWWSYNPIGKMMLDLLLPDVSEFKKFIQIRESILDKRQCLLETIRRRLPADGG